MLAYCVLLEVTDRPGVFAQVAAAFGDEQVSIASIVQKSRGVTADVVAGHARGAGSGDAAVAGPPAALNVVAASTPSCGSPRRSRRRVW